MNDQTTNPSTTSTTNPSTPELEPGCYFDSHRGQYIGEAIIELAESLGYKVQNDTDRTPEGEFYHDEWTSAEDYLNDYTPEGFFFGQNENGDAGVWEVESDD